MDALREKQSLPQTPTSWALLALLTLLVLVTRLAPWGTLETAGPDERFYSIYISSLKKVGPLGYHQLFDDYIAFQSDAASQLVLPPSRVTFISSAALWSGISGREPLAALRDISAASSILLALVAGGFAARAGGYRVGLAVLALMACAPLQIYMAHRALIDGFFALLATLALLALWESVRAPRSKLPSIWLGLALAALVATKENSAFVYMGLLISASVLHFSKTAPLGRNTMLALLWGPALGALTLVVAAGGIEPLVTALRLNVQKSVLSPYAHMTGDGPLHRYLIDLVIVSPFVTLAAVAGMFRARWKNAEDLLLLTFTLTTFLVMSQIKLGLNLRYAAIWDFTLCWFAVGELLCVLPVRARNLWLPLAVAVACVSGLCLYQNIFATGKVYDPVPAAMLRALDIDKR